MLGASKKRSCKQLRIGAMTCLAAAAFLAINETATAQGIGRVEIHPIPTVTVTSQQFLSGDRYGKPVMLAGELRLPRASTEKFPAVILVHGSGGVGPAHD